MTSPEWRPVSGHPGYEVSDLGEVRSWHRPRGTWATKPRTLVPYLSAGYPTVRLAGMHRKKVHWLVAEAFLGQRPEGAEVAHGDGNRLNCAVANLRYATHLENMSDSVRHGTTTRGERQAGSKLTADSVQEIRRLCQLGVKKRSIADRFGISAPTVSDILAGRSWAWLEESA